MERHCFIAIFPNFVFERICASKYLGLLWDGFVVVWSDGDFQKYLSILQPKDILDSCYISLQEELLQKASLAKRKLPKKEEFEPEGINETLARKRLEAKVRTWIQQTPAITKNHFLTAKNVLHYLGLDTLSLRIEGEAEAYCAYLCCHQQVSAVVTNDTDVLPLGSHRVLRNISYSNETCQRIRIDHLLNGLSEASGTDIPLKRFRDMCILLGTDYNDNPPGCGPVRVWQIMTTCERIEEIAGKFPNVDISGIDYKTSRRMFRIPKKFSAGLRKGKISTEKLQSYINTFPISRMRANQLNTYFKVDITSDSNYKEVITKEMPRPPGSTPSCKQLKVRPDRARSGRRYYRSKHK